MVATPVPRRFVIAAAKLGVISAATADLVLHIAAVLPGRDRCREVG